MPWVEEKPAKGWWEILPAPLQFVEFSSNLMLPKEQAPGARLRRPQRQRMDRNGFEQHSRSLEKHSIYRIVLSDRSLPFALVRK